MPTDKLIRSKNFGVFYRSPTVHLRERIRNIEHIDLARSHPLRMVFSASIFVGIASALRNRSSLTFDRAACIIRQVQGFDRVYLGRSFS